MPCDRFRVPPSVFVSAVRLGQFDDLYTLFEHSNITRICNGKKKIAMVMGLFAESVRSALFIASLLARVCNALIKSDLNGSYWGNNFNSVPFNSLLTKHILQQRWLVFLCCIEKFAWKFMKHNSAILRSLDVFGEIFFDTPYFFRCVCRFASLRSISCRATVTFDYGVPIV